MGTVPTTRDELIVALSDTVADAVCLAPAQPDGGIEWTWDRDRIHYTPLGFLHTDDADRILAQMITEIQICAEHGWPWDHALVEPWLCYIEGTEFVGAQGGLHYTRDLGRWE